MALGIACALTVERWIRWHLLPIALGVAGAMVLVSVAGQDWTGGPTYLIADGEGNVDVEPGAYIVRGLFAAGLATAPWGPRDRSAVVLTALSAATVTYWWWLPALPDTSGPGWPWLWLATGLFIATVALPARRWVPWATAGAAAAAIVWAGSVTGYFRYPPGAWGAFVWLLAVIGAPGALITAHAARIASPSKATTR